MKKIILSLALLWGLGMCVFALDEKKAAMGMGPEWNMNSRYNFAGGACLGIDYKLPYSFAAGLTAGASNNFTGITVVEGAALFRWYFLADSHSGFFAQLDMGGFFIFENEEITPLFLGGLRGGYRLPMGKQLYIEPYGRLGYPFVFGIGMMTGIQF